MPKITIAIITLGRFSLYKTLSSLFWQNVNKKFEILLILQGNIDENMINTLNLQLIPLRIYKFDHFLGFGYYRNRALELAEGDVVVFIDDDEWAMNDDWLAILTQPIFAWKYSVVTSGCFIPQTSSYITNSISSLGYPGGGSIWFKKLWNVYNDKTKHLCSGNFAIDKNIINFSFSESTYFWGEDNILAKLLQENNIMIYYEQLATVYHQPRNLIDSIAWWRGRNKSARILIQTSWLDEPVLQKIFKRCKIYFRLDIYLPGRLFLLIIQLFLLIKYANE